MTTFLSVCSGIEAASVAWNPLGWEALAFSEIASFPSAVLKHHYPDVPNLGDLNGQATWAIRQPDVLIGGNSLPVLQCRRKARRTRRSPRAAHACLSWPR